MDSSRSTDTVRHSIGILAKRTGCSIETIRYYERIGLMPAPPRTPGGRRTYDDGHLRHLTLIRRSRELGFSLEDVRNLKSLIDGDHFTCERVKTITLKQLASTRRRIATLQRLELVLDEMTAECTGGEDAQCPIVEALRDRPLEQPDHR